MDEHADGIWISTFAPAQVRARAEQVDPGLPLAGMLFAVKDNIDVAGLPTTAACPDFAYEPERNAPVVQRLIDAGAIVVGKTNLDQFATGLTGARSPYGVPESVFGGGLIPGGSSSGSAVAVADGSVVFSLGTDTAGSGRVPAALNGIVGVKPTRGLLSTLGVVPAGRSLDCVSVFARDVATADRVVRVAQGRVPGDPWGRDGAQPVLAEPRIGVATGLDFFGDAGQEEAYGRFTGDRVVDVGPLLEAGDLLYGPWVAERLADLGDFLRDHPDSVLPVTRAVLESGLRFTAADAFRAHHRLRELRALADRLWNEIDVLVLPTVGTTYTHAEIAEDPIGRNLNLGRYTQFANLLDLAAVTVPNGFTGNGRPASLTLFGPAFSDRTLARLARSWPAAAELLTIAVAGLHLTGEPRNHELLDRGGALLGPARTAPCYRLYRLPSGLPALVRDDADGAAIDLELWRLPAATVGSLLAGIPAPLGLGRVTLADGAEVTGFLGEAYATAGALDITAGGGWRNYRLGGHS